MLRIFITQTYLCVRTVYNGHILGFFIYLITDDIELYSRKNKMIKVKHVIGNIIWLRYNFNLSEIVVQINMIDRPPFIQFDSHLAHCMEWKRSLCPSKDMRLSSVLSSPYLNTKLFKLLFQSSHEWLRSLLFHYSWHWTTYQRVYGGHLLFTIMIYYRKCPEEDRYICLSSKWPPDQSFPCLHSIIIYRRSHTK